MDNSKLILHLKTLSKEELKRFGLFVNSPYFSRSKPVSQLFSLLKKYYPDFLPQKINKRLIFSKLFPSSAKYTSRQVTDLMAKLSLLLKEFLYIEGCRQEENTKQIELIDLEIMKQRKLDDFFFRRTNHLLDKLLKKEVPGPEDHLQIYRLSMLNFSHPNMQRLKGDSDATLQQASKHLDQFYYLSKLRLICELQNRRNILNSDQPPLQIPHPLQGKKEFPNNPLINLYLKLLDFIQNKNIDDYKRLKLLFAQVAEHLDKTSLLEITNLQMNWLFYLYNQGQTSNLEEILELLQNGFEREIFIENGYIDKDHFLNFFNLHATLKKTTQGWANLERYKQHLQEGIRENVVSLCKAYLYFADSQFIDCVCELQYVRFNDLSFRLRVHQLTVQSYFEEFFKNKEMLPDLKRAIDRYQQCLRANENIAGAIREGNERFCQFVIKILRATQEEPLKSQIMETEHLICRKWLLFILNKMVN